jgi:hypothetical protein
MGVLTTIGDGLEDAFLMAWEVGAETFYFCSERCLHAFETEQLETARDHTHGCSTT